jgi:hypothetical protein
MAPGRTDLLVSLDHLGRPASEDLPNFISDQLECSWRHFWLVFFVQKDNPSEDGGGYT